MITFSYTKYKKHFNIHFNTLKQITNNIDLYQLCSTHEQFKWMLYIITVWYEYFNHDGLLWRTIIKMSDCNWLENGIERERIKTCQLHILTVYFPYWFYSQECPPTHTIVPGGVTYSPAMNKCIGLRCIYNTYDIMYGFDCDTAIIMGHNGSTFSLQKNMSTYAIMSYDAIWDIIRLKPLWMHFLQHYQGSTEWHYVYNNTR